MHPCAKGEFEMTDDPSSSAPRKELTPAAQRALAEAEARRKAAEASATRQATFDTGTSTVNSQVKIVQTG